MPSPYVNKLSKETGKSISEIEVLWKKAKDVTAETFGKTEDDFGSKEYSYCVGIVKNMLGIEEKYNDPEAFMNSDLSAYEYIHEDTNISGNFSVGDNNPVIPPEDIEEDGDEDEEDDSLEHIYGAAEDNNDEDVEEGASTKTAVCPNCGSKYLVSTGYCLKCKKKVAEPEE